MGTYKYRLTQAAAGGFTIAKEPRRPGRRRPRFDEAVFAALQSRGPSDKQQRKGIQSSHAPLPHPPSSDSLQLP